MLLHCVSKVIDIIPFFHSNKASTKSSMMEEILTRQKKTLDPMTAQHWPAAINQPKVATKS